MRYISRLAGVLILGFALASCGSTKDIAYFQDALNQSQINTQAPQTLTLGVSDKISIIVHSKDPELAAIFNLPIAAQRVGMAQTNTLLTSNYQISTYTVDADGDIDFPILGSIHVAGLHREEVARMIKNMIIAKNYIKDPVVTVEFASFYVSVIGEVSRPGRYLLEKDKVTLLDAIANAGDLTINGERTNVKVFREEGGKQKCYTVNFTDSREVFASPVYYLRQDDIIYVEPNPMRKRQSTVNGNSLTSASFWVSAGSLLTSITSMAVTIYLNVLNLQRGR